MTPPAHAPGLYDPLELDTEGDVRLVKIVDYENGNVNCRLIKTNLRKGLQYVAISYTWGPSNNEEYARGVSSNPTHRITCNGYDILVTENLFNFLVRAAENSKLASKYMWIDGICIDQSNLLERTHQVNIMSVIYHSADAVVVWLGEEDEYTPSGFDLIRTLGSLPSDTLKQITPSWLGTGKMRQILSSYGELEHWRSLVRIFQRRYFTRVWIIQEITLATKRLAVCGGCMIDWEDVVKVSNFLTVTSWTNWISTGRILDASGPHHSYHPIPNLLEANKRTKIANERNLLLYSLIRARRFHASDPRDKVYALLGIGGESAKGKTKYNPVYKDRSVAETYTLAAIQLLEDSDDLLVLAHAEGDLFRNELSLPSWVPDWSCTLVVGLGVTGYARYSACGQVPRSLYIDEKSHSLIIKGVRLDQIISAAESKEDVLKQKPIPRLLSMVGSLPERYQTGQAMSEVFWRVLLTDTAGVPPVCPAPYGYGRAFTSWFKNILLATGQYAAWDAQLTSLQILGSHVNPPVGGSPPTFQSPSHEDEILEGTSSESDIAEFETFFSHALHLRPFLTSKSYLGVGSKSLLEGDSVWIIAGSRVPLILRDAGRGHYKVVGGAYVHGFMKGEGWMADCVEEITLI